MNVYLYVIAPNTERELTTTLEALELCAVMIKDGDDFYITQELIMAYFNSDEDLNEAIKLLKQGLNYRGTDNSGEYQAGVSQVSMDVAKLEALEQLIIDMEASAADGPTHF
jgi:hypothetical protein